MKKNDNLVSGRAVIAEAKRRPAMEMEFWLDKAYGERLLTLETLFDHARQILGELRRTRGMAPTGLVQAPHPWPKLPTDWPRLPERVSTSAFLRPDYLDLYRPGAAVEVYVAACAGLGRIAGTLYVPQFKIGTCVAGRVGERVRQLSRDRYAAAWRDNDVWREDEDFADWFASFIDCRDEPAPGSPVSLTDRSFVVALPATMSHTRFENLLRRELQAIDASVWFGSPAGRRHCALAQAPLAIGVRATAYQIGMAQRLSAASEIYVFRRRGDAGRLLRLLEALVLRETITPTR